MGGRSHADGIVPGDSDSIGALTSSESRIRLNPSSNAATEPVLRVKRDATEAMFEYVTVELGPVRKRPRSVRAAFAGLGLGGSSYADNRADAPREADHAAPVDTPREADHVAPADTQRRTVRFRRLPPTVGGPRRSIAKEKVIDIARNALRHARRSEAQEAVTETPHEHKKSDTDRENDPSHTKTSQRQSTNGSEAAQQSRDDEEGENVVYDLYVRDDAPLANAGRAIEVLRDDDLKHSAVLMAEDVPEHDLWRLCGDSDLVNEDSEDSIHEDSTEGSVDYPDTPNDDAYTDEVVSQDMSEPCFGSSDASGFDEDSDGFNEYARGAFDSVAERNATFLEDLPRRRTVNDWDSPSSEHGSDYD